MSKTSLNSVSRVQPNEANVYEFLDDFTDEDEPTPVVQRQPPSPKYSRQSSGSGRRRRSRRHSTRMTQPLIIYKRVQTGLICTCLLLSLVQMGLVIWMNVDKRFRFLADISNMLPYASLDRLFGLYPVIALSLTTLALVLDIIQYGQFVFIKSFLRSSEKERLTRFRFIRLQQVIAYVKTYTLMTHLFYIFIIVTLQLLIASYLIVNFNLILNYQTSQTLIKLLREYEKQTSEKEIKLVEMMHRVFKCCHYQNPYQFGDLSPPECNKTQGCLRPIQEFTWVYLYVSIGVAIAMGVLKFAIQVLLVLNFYWLLLNRLIRNLNDHKQTELVMVGDEDADSWEDRAEGDRKLAEIRRAKEVQLEMEEREEEARRAREAEERARREEFERRQDEYELMLFKQKRYDELRIEQMNRRLQQQQQ